MEANKSGLRWRRALSVPLLVLVSMLPLAGNQGQTINSGPLASTQHLPSAPGSLRLYVFDCGKLTIGDPGPFGFKKDDLATTDMSDPCFLVVHPKGTLMWEVGVLPDSVFTTVGSVTRGAATVTKPLKAQLAEVGYVPADITYLAFSHCHGDHTANANDFATATWLVRQVEHEAMFAQPPSGCWAPESYSALRDSKTVILTHDDYDVFGDGAVILKFAPGHTPGHQVLFLNLRKTGPVLLSGDLYHYPEERTHHRVPTREFNREQTIVSRGVIETLLKKTGAQLWIQHDFTANAKLKKAPAFYE
jgi:N-acyl homoserine lactone hydrolase